MAAAIKTLSKKLGYEFKKPSLLEEALCHRSFRTKNNERLEFLGDSILNFIMAAELFRRYPEAKEGELSRQRASLVREETLAALAREFELGHYLRLGPGELKSGGKERASILADALEAIIGAIYLDVGMEICQQRVLAWYEKQLTTHSVLPDAKDAKTLLQEYLQAHYRPLPVYTVLSIEGASHQQTFTVECRLENNKVAVGKGSSRRRGEQEAAQKILQQLSKP